MNEKMKSIQAPSDIRRKPRTVDEIGHWKASEFKNFLFHYGVFSLMGLLPKDIFDSFVNLCIFSRLLNSSKMNEKILGEAEKRLQAFKLSFRRLYGKSSMSMNCHLLNHLIDQVRALGPLWKTSAFGFESANRFIVKGVSGTVKRPQHMVESFLERQKYSLRSKLTSKKRSNKFVSVPDDVLAYLKHKKQYGHIDFYSTFKLDNDKFFSSLSYTRLRSNKYELI